MTRFRLAILLGAVAVAAPASAQQGAPEKSESKSPIASITERGPNPKGPFAKLSMLQSDSIIEHTRSLLGTRYKWAGASPEKGIDCSGLVMYVFAKLGIELPHRAAELAKLGGSISKDTAEMQPGDLLVFGKGKRISHVGIYVGDGMMIHASSTSHRVVEAPVDKYRPAGTLQWKGVRRVIAVDSTMAEVAADSVQAPPIEP
jgi:cell wall-associated NlpC family hydrolase